MNVVDSSGWIEYFQDTPRADLFASAIEDRAHLLVQTISLFEVHSVLSRALPAEIVETCLDVMRRGRVLDLTDPRAIAASEAATRHGMAWPWPMPPFTAWRWSTVPRSRRRMWTTKGSRT